MLSQNIRNILTQKIYVLFSLTGQIRHIVQSVYFPALCVLRQSAVSSRVSWVALHWRMLPSNLVSLCYLSVKRVFRGGEYMSAYRRDVLARVGVGCVRRDIRHKKCQINMWMIRCGVLSQKREKETSLLQECTCRGSYLERTGCIVHCWANDNTFVWLKVLLCH